MANQQDRLLLLMCRSTSAKPLTTREQSVLDKWFARNSDRLNIEITEEYIREILALEKLAEASWKRFEEKYYDKLYPAPTLPPQPGKNTRSVKIAVSLAAAAVLAVIFAVSYFSHQRQPGIHTTMPVALRPDTITPGGYKASLTLGNGSVIVLDTAQTGFLAFQGGSSVTLPANGRLEYEQLKTGNETNVYSNTLTTPRGGQYFIKLPDGTGVKLNAASSLRYPSAFTGKERVVQLEGEAWFEVAKDRKKPFIVTLKDNSRIQALGTKFNVNAYHDESSYTTTLLEGSVKVSSGKDNMLLKPGQRAIIDSNKNIALALHPDIERETAWTKDSFNFDGLDYTEVMKQLQRWYDFELVNNNSVKSRYVVIRYVRRTTPLKDILDNLKGFVPFNYQIQGKKVTLTD